MPIICGVTVTREQMKRNGFNPLPGAREYLPSQFVAGVHIVGGYVLPSGFQFAIWDLLENCAIGLYSNSRHAIDQELAICNAGGGARFGVVDLYDLAETIAQYEGV